MRDSSVERGYKGYCIDLLDKISEMAHFNYTIQEVDGYGRMDENGEWNGIIRKLIDREADIGLGTMQVMTERERVVDFTIPYYDLVGYTILMLIPQPKTTFFKFLTVLELNVWGCILGAYVLTRCVNSYVIFQTKKDDFSNFFWSASSCTVLIDGVHTVIKTTKKNMQMTMRKGNSQ